MSVCITDPTNEHIFCQLRNPELDNSYKVEQNIAYGRSAAGQLYRYNKGITIKNIKVEWRDLTNVEKEALEEIFVYISTNDFIYTDHAGNNWNAHFTIGNLDFVEIYDETENADNFYIGDVLMPSTTRKNSRWAVSLEMEIWA